MNTISQPFVMLEDQAGFVARGLTCDATTHPEIPWWMIIATLRRIIRDDTPKQLTAVKGKVQS